MKSNGVTPGNGEWQREDQPLFGNKTFPPDRVDEGSLIALDRIRIPHAPHRAGVQVNGEQIRSVTHRDDGEHFIAMSHRNLFRSRHAPQMAQLREYLVAVGTSIDELKRRLGHATARLHGIDELVLATQPGATGVPWTRADRLKWVVLLIVSLGLLVIGVNTLATYLMGSGFIMFARQPILAYVLSCVNLAVSFALKSIARLLSDRGRRRYELLLAAFGIGCGAIWILTFALLFANFSGGSLDEIVQTLQSGTSSFRKSLENVFVGAQLFSEIAIAATLWLHMEGISSRHNPNLVASANPEHEAYLGLVLKLNDQLRVAIDLRGRIQGELAAFQALEEVLVASARAQWIKESTVQPQ
jgi:hypothetical protein